MFTQFVGRIILVPPSCFHEHLLPDKALHLLTYLPLVPIKCMYMVCNILLPHLIIQVNKHDVFLLKQFADK